MNRIIKRDIPIIGIHGKARSGKDTIANYLVKHHNFLRVGFADKIKVVSAMIYDIDLDLFYSDEYKEIVIENIGKSPREIAQLMGTEAGRRVFGNEIWFYTMENIIMRLRDKACIPDWLFKLPHGYRPINTNYAEDYHGLVISDARMDFEVDWIHQQGGKVWGVYRDGADGSVGITNHATESDNLSMCDAKIENNGTIEELDTKVSKYEYRN